MNKYSNFTKFRLQQSLIHWFSMQEITVIILALLCILLVNHVVAQTLKSHKENRPIYQDENIDANIKSILLYPQNSQTNNASASLSPPIVPLSVNTALLLEFDYLGNSPENYRAKIYHCNMNWQPSVLSEVEYLPDFNDFILNSYQTSMAVKVPYLHYTFEVPPVKVSGNFVLIVYNEKNKNDLKFIRRFCVVEPRVLVNGKVNYSASIAQRHTHQQVDFEINYPQLSTYSPRDDFKVLIRQNFRWENIITGLKPSLISESDARLVYQFFNLENSFEGGNEFHFFDFRNSTFAGMNVGNVERQASNNLVYLLFDHPQARKAYIRSDDFDGMFVIDQAETHRGATESDYARVVFTLQMPEISEKNVYLQGAFNLWKKDESTQMAYNYKINAYQTDVLLKQGIYNYKYAVEDSQTHTIADNNIDGTFSQTQNTYEIFIYYRPLGARADLLVGYAPIENL